MEASRVRRSGISATGVSGWPKPVRRSASRSKRLPAWLSRYRRLNTIFERSKDRLVAVVAIAFISILARRLKRLVAEDISA